MPLAIINRTHSLIRSLCYSLIAILCLACSSKKHNPSDNFQLNIALKEEKASEVRLPITQLSLKHADGHIVTLFEKDKIVIFEPGNHHQKLFSTFVKPGIYTHLNITLRIKDSYYAEAVSVNGELQDVSVTLSDYNDSDFITSRIEHPLEIKKDRYHHYRLVYDTQGSFKFAHSLSGTDENLVYSPHLELNKVPINPPQQVITPPQVSPSRQISPPEQIPVPAEVSNIPAMVYGLDENTIIIKAKGELVTVKQDEVTLIDATTRVQLTTDFIHIGQRIDINKNLEKIFIHHTHFLVKKNTSSFISTQKTYDILSINDNHSIRLNNTNLLYIDDSQLSISMSDINATYWKVSGLYYKDSDGQSTLKAETADIIGLDNCTLTVDFSKEHNATLLSQIESSHTQLSFDSQTARTAQFYLTVDELNIDVPVTIDHILLLEGQYQMNKPERGKENNLLESETYIDQETLHISELNKQFKRYFDNHQWLQNMYLRGAYSPKEQTFSAKNGAFTVSAADIDSPITQQILSPFQDPVIPLSAASPAIEEALIITLATTLPIAAGIAGIITYLYKQGEIDRLNNQIKTQQNDILAGQAELENNKKALVKNIEDKKEVDLSYKELQKRLAATSLSVEELRKEGLIKDQRAKSLTEKIEQADKELRLLEQTRDEQNREKQQLEQDLADSNLRINTLALNNNENEMRLIRQSHNQLQSNFDAMSRNHEALNRDRQNLLEKLQQAYTDIGALQLRQQQSDEYIQQLAIDNNNTQEELARSEQTQLNRINDFKENIQNLQENTIKIFNEKGQLEEDLHAANDQLNLAKNRIIELDNDGLASAQAIKALEEKIEETEQAFEQAKANIVHRDETIHELKKQINALDDNIEQLYNDNKIHQDTEEELIKRNIDLEKELQTHKDLQIDKNNIIEDLESNNLIKSKLIEELEADNKLKGNQISQLKESEKNNHLEITRLKEHENQSKIKLHDLETELANTQSEIKQLEQENETQGMEKDKLSEQYAKINNALTDLKKNTNDKDGKIKKLNSELEQAKLLTDQVEVDKKKLTLLNDQLEKRLSEYQNAYKALEEQKIRADNSIKSSSDTIFALQNQLQTKDNRLSELIDINNDDLNKIKELKENNDNLLKTEGSLRSLIAEQDQKIKELIGQNQISNKETEKLKAKNDDLSNQMRQFIGVNNELERAKAELSRFQESIKSLNQILDLDESLDTIDDLKKITDHIKVTYSNYEELQKTIRERDHALDQMEEKLAAQNLMGESERSLLNKTIKNLEKQLLASESSAIELRQNHQEIEKEMTKKENLIEELHKKGNTTELENQGLIKDITTLKNQFEELKTVNSEVSQRKSEVSQQLLSVQKELSSTQEEKISLADKNQVNEETIKQLEDMLEDMKTSNEIVIRSLKHELKDNGEAEKIRTEQAKEQLERAQDRQKELELANADLTEQAKRLSKDLTEKSAQAQNQDQAINEYEMQIDNLQVQVSSLEERLLSGQESYQDNIDQLIKRIEEQKKDNEELEKELDNTKNSNNATLAEREEYIEVLDEQLSSARQLLEAKKNERVQYELKNAELENSLRESKENNDYLMENIAKLEINNQDLIQKLQLAQKNLTNAESKNNDLEDRIYELEAYQNRLKDLAIQIHDHIKDKSSQYMEADLSRWKPSEILQEINRSLNQVFLDRDNIASESSSTLQQIEEEIAPFLDKQAELLFENQRLTSDNKTLLEQLSDSELTNETLKTQIGELATNNVALNKEYATLLEQHEQHRSEFTAQQELLASVIEKQELEMTEQQNNIQHLKDELERLTSTDYYQNNMIETISDELSITKRRPDLWQQLSPITATDPPLSIGLSRSLDSLLDKGGKLIPTSGAQGLIQKEVTKINEASYEADTVKQQGSKSSKSPRR